VIGTARSCPVCKARMTRHCPRPDCLIWVCDSCPLAWDDKVKMASALKSPQSPIHHEEVRR